MILHKMNRYVKTCGIKDVRNKLMSFYKDDEKLLEMYEAIWTKVENFKNIKLNALTVYGDICIRNKQKSKWGQILY